MNGSDRPALSAVLWDMDGLLVDSEPLWTIAERELCTGWGVEFTPSIKAAMIGRRLDEAVAILMAATGVRADAAQVAGRLLDRMVSLFSSGPPLQPGVADLLDELDRRGVPSALVSSSLRALVDALPDRLLSRFAATVAGDEVALAKPDPGGYLAAAGALRVPPRFCVVLEDTAAGAQAGLAAGCGVLVVPSVTPVPPEPAWAQRPTLAGISVDDLELLMPAQDLRAG